MPDPEPTAEEREEARRLFKAWDEAPGSYEETTTDLIDAIARALAARRPPPLSGDASEEEAEAFTRGYPRQSATRLGETAVPDADELARAQKCWDELDNREEQPGETWPLAEILVIANALRVYGDARERQRAEEDAKFVEGIARELDSLAADNVKSELIHGILTDNACAVRNIAEAIRARAEGRKEC